MSANRGQIDGLPANPRRWSAAKLEQLKASMQETPELTEARGCIVIQRGQKFVVIGGNMRLAAAKDLGWKEMPCMVLPPDTPVEKLREIAIKDNGQFGRWDYDKLANEWDTETLNGWGVDVWNVEKPAEDWAREQEWEQGLNQAEGQSEAPDYDDADAELPEVQSADKQRVIIVYAKDRADDLKAITGLDDLPRAIDITEIPMAQ